MMYIIKLYRFINESIYASTYWNEGSLVIAYRHTDVFHSLELQRKKLIYSSSFTLLYIITLALKLKSII